MKSPQGEAILLEVYTVVECVAPAALHVERFLPPKPVRVLVDHANADLTEQGATSVENLEKGDPFRLLDRGVVKKKILPLMLETALRLSTEKMQALVAEAVTAMNQQLEAEIERLKDLQEINNHVSPQEITALQEQQKALAAAMTVARVRLSSLRLILRTQ